MREKKRWYKLDLSANVYPTLQSRTFSSLFRLSFTLKERVDPALLQQAFAMTLPRFPTMKVMMKKGLFWRFLEPNPNPAPLVLPDVNNPCMPIHFHNQGKYLIRVYYYEKHISLEVFHSLSDGNGALLFLKTMTAVYLRLTGAVIPDGEGVLDIREEPGEEELEDAYIKYATSKVKPPRSQGNAYRVRGIREPFYTLNIISGSMSSANLKEVAKGYQVTITEYLNAVLLYALQEKQSRERGGKLKPVRVAMPVDLRRFFPSRTLRNFISMVYPGIDPRMGDYTFEEIVKQVHHYMQYHINPKFLRADITTNAHTQQSWWVRVVPLFIKDMVVRQFYKKVQDAQSSAGLTNLGIVRVPLEMEEYLERFDVLMGQPFSARTNCAVATFAGTTVINFASCIVETEVERLFFRRLVKDGIHVKIQTNRKQEV